VPLVKDAVAALNALLEERGVAAQTQAAVFINARKQSLSRFGVIYILRRAVNAAAKGRPSVGTKAISPHTLRHYVPFLTMSSDIGQVRFSI
jgi:integrase/recombinase XerD